METSFREAFGEALLEAGESTRNLVVIDTDVLNSTKTIYFARRFPERFIQMGISEQDAAGMAAGLAISGKIPVLATFSMFLLRSWEQIRNTIARDNLSVKIVGTHSGLSDYLDGASHQCLEDIALMRVLPNMTVISPADDISTRSLFHQALELRGPVYIRLGRDNARRIYRDYEDVTIGKANILVDGDDMSIISCGAFVSISLNVANILREKGFRPRVIDSHTIKPLDTETIIKAAREASPVFVIEEHNIFGGLGSAVAEIITERTPTHVFRIGVPDVFGTGGRSYEELLRYFRLTPPEIVKKIEGMINGL